MFFKVNLCNSFTGKIKLSQESIFDLMVSSIGYVYAIELCTDIFGIYGKGSANYHQKVC